MRSPFSFGKVLLFLLINIVVSAFTTWIVVRVLVPPIGESASALNIVAPPPATQAPTSEAAPANAANPADATTAPDETTTNGANASANPEATPTLLDNTSANGNTGDSVEATATLLDATAAATGINVRISTIIYPGQLSRERVVIVNEGEQVNLENWKIVSPRGEAYTFGRVTLFQNGFINLNTTTGADVPSDLFWGSGTAIWQSGDEVKLVDKDNATVATFTIK